MASRKKPVDQGSLFAAPPIATASTIPQPSPNPAIADTPVVAERTMRLVHSALRTEVIVEPDGPDYFVVSLLRHYGTTVASVRYSRAQLEMLVQKASAALEVG